MLSDLLSLRAQSLRERGLWRERTLVDGVPIARHFASNDYLGLSADARVRQVFADAFARLSPCSTGSLVVSGYHPEHKALEAAFCEALEVEDCLVFGAGYTANLAIGRFLGRNNITLVMDKAMHASVYDGVSAAEGRFLRFRHVDADDMQAKVARAGDNTAVMTESVFSMTGEIAPLALYAERLRATGVPLVVDEAHAFGVLGPEGLGGVAAAGVAADVALRVIPFGKAFAAQGAVVAGEALYVQSLLQEARSCIYSTAMSPALARGLCEMLPIMRAADVLRGRLHEIIDYFRACTRASPLSWADSKTAIQQLRLGCPHRALMLARFLREKGFFCMAMREPTVTRAQTGLRVLLNSQHTPEAIDDFLNHIHAFHDTCDS